MPLPSSVPREELHQRRIDMRGFRRADGLYDVEAHLMDIKTAGMTVGNDRFVPAGEAIHDMWVRLVIDEDFKVIDVVASTDAAPQSPCPQATATLQSIKGLRIGAGWSKAVRERLAGARGCTHLTELLVPLATVAIQTLWQVRASMPVPVNALGKPLKIDSCFAYASNCELVKQRWPQFYQAVPKDGLPAESKNQ